MHKWYTMTCHLFGWTPVIVLFLLRYKSALRQRFRCTLSHLFTETSLNKLHIHQQIPSFIRYQTQWIACVRNSTLAPGRRQRIASSRHD